MRNSGDVHLHTIFSYLKELDYSIPLCFPADDITEINKQILCQNLCVELLYVI